MIFYLLAACGPAPILEPGVEWTLIEPLPGLAQAPDCFLSFRVAGPPRGMLFWWAEDCGRYDLPLGLGRLDHNQWGTVYDVEPGGWWYLRPGTEEWAELWVYDQGQDIEHDNLSALAVVPAIHTDDLDQ